MAWTIEYVEPAKRAMKRLDRQTAKRIATYMDTRVANNPRQLGEAMTGNRGGLWRYRIGDYRVVCDIQDDKVRVLVLEVGHRREIYRNR